MLLCVHPNGLCLEPVSFSIIGAPWPTLSSGHFLWGRNASSKSSRDHSVVFVPLLNPPSSLHPSTTSRGFGGPALSRALLYLLVMSHSHGHSHGGRHSHSHSSGHQHRFPAPPLPYPAQPDIDASSSSSSSSSAMDHSSRIDKEDLHKATVVATFDSYLRQSVSANQRRRGDFYSLQEEHRALLPGYAELLGEVDKKLEINELLVKAMVEQNVFPPSRDASLEAKAPSEAEHEVSWRSDRWEKE